MMIDYRYEPPLITATEEEREQMLEWTERKICEVTDEMDRERATLGRVRRGSVERLLFLEGLREKFND
jgi:hypothetical protein